MKYIILKNNLFIMKFMEEIEKIKYFVKNE